MHKRLAMAVTVATALLGATTASATSLTLLNPAPSNQIYQQTQNRPCVIGDPSCNNPAGFGFTPIVENGGWTTSLDSPTYTVGQIEGILGGAGAFLIGIDVNTAGATKDPPFADLADEHLLFFEVWIGGSLAFNYASPDTVNGTQLRIPNNGNGDSDDLLSVVDLSGFGLLQSIFFRARILNASDGKEEFFLIPSVGAVQQCTVDCGPITPEPASLLLLGTGLAGAAFALRRRAKARS